MAIKLRAVVKHPSRVESGTGIAVEKANGVVTASLDLMSISESVGATDPTAARLLLVTPGDPDVYELLTVDGLLALAVAYDAELAAIAGLASTADKVPYFTGSGTAALADLPSYGRTLIANATAADARTDLGLVIGTDVQAYDVELAAISSLTSAADKLPYFTGSETAGLADFTAFARTLLDDATAGAALTTLGVSAFAQTILDDANAAAVLTTLGVSAFAQTLLDDADASTARATLGLVIGTDVQAYDAELAALAGLTSAADKVPYFTGAGTAAVADFTSLGRTLIANTNAGDARSDLGLVIGTDVQAQDAVLADLAGLTLAQGDVLYFDGTNLVNLGPGTDGHFLKTQGAGANPVWEAIPGGGDMLAANNLSDVDDVTTARENIHAALKGALFGLKTSNNGTDSDHDIDIALGEVASDDSADPILMRLPSVLTKRIDATWAVGTGNGGLDTGAVANDTWYYLWLIERSDTGAVDVLFSTSSSSPTMPADYDHKQLIWAIKTDGSANILPYTQVNSECVWSTVKTDVSVANQGTSVVSRTLSHVPPLLGVIAHFNASISVAAGTTAVEFASGLRPDASFTSLTFNLVNESVGTFAAGQFKLPVNGSGQIKTDASAASTSVNIYTTGFEFPG